MQSITLQNHSTTIIIGEPKLDPSKLQKAFESIGIQIDVKQADHPCNRILWVRDYTVCLPTGTHLIPRPLNFFDQLQCETLIPPYSNDRLHSINTRFLGGGIKYDGNYSSSLLRILKENKVYYRNSPCSLEGGNVLFFYDAEGKSRVLIGFNSVVATYISLLVQNFFVLNKCHDEPFAEPSDEAYYAARNQYYFQMGYLEGVNSPLSLLQKTRFFPAAVIIEKCYRIVKKIISQDIGIDDPIFVPQGEFHIDMALLPLNGKNVVLYHKDSNPLLDPYHEKIEKVLRDHGLIPKAVVAVVKRLAQQINLMNVLQINSAIIVPTTPAEFKDIDDQFIKDLTNEGVNVARIDLPRDTISECNGGLHCFTTEYITRNLM